MLCAKQHAQETLLPLSLILHVLSSSLTQDDGPLQPPPQGGQRNRIEELQQEARWRVRTRRMKYGANTNLAGEGGGGNCCQRWARPILLTVNILFIVSRENIG